MLTLLSKQSDLPFTSTRLIVIPARAMGTCALTQFARHCGSVFVFTVPFEILLVHSIMTFACFWWFFFFFPTLVIFLSESIIERFSENLEKWLSG